MVKIMGSRFGLDIELSQIMTAILGSEGKHQLSGQLAKGRFSGVIKDF